MSWSGVVESTYGEEGNYTLTTSADDPTCMTPFGPGYVDLFDATGGAITADPEIGIDEETGDTVTYTAFADRQYGFYGQGYNGLRFSDDGFLVYGAGYAGQPWVPQAVPNALAPNNLAALLWQDMQIRYDEDTNAGVSLATAGAQVRRDRRVRRHAAVRRRGPGRRGRSTWRSSPSPAATTSSSPTTTSRREHSSRASRSARRTPRAPSVHPWSTRVTRAPSSRTG